MDIKPDQYAPLLEYHYGEIRDWVETGEIMQEIADLEPLLTQYQDLIAQWVRRNEQLRDHTTGKRLADHSVIGYVAFLESQETQQ